MTGRNLGFIVLGFLALCGVVAAIVIPGRPALASATAFQPPPDSPPAPAPVEIAGRDGGPAAALASESRTRLIGFRQECADQWGANPDMQLACLKMKLREHRMGLIEALKILQDQ
ncbi:MAG: hypothetical protein ABI868_04435 [Acidobacteriota bacterium]